MFYVGLAAPSSGPTHQVVDHGTQKASSPAVPALEKDMHEPNQAMTYVKEFCYSHIRWVPGGQHYLDTAFKDIEVLKQTHKDEVDHILSDIYEELQIVSNAGFSLQNVRKTFNIFTLLSERLGELAGGVRPSSSTTT